MFGGLLILIWLELLRLWDEALWGCYWPLVGVRPRRWLDISEALLSLATGPFDWKDGERIIGVVVFKSTNL